MSPFVLVKLTKNRPLDGEVRRERQAEQTALAAADDRGAEVEEVFGDDAIANDADAAALLDGVEDRRIGGIGDEGDRRLQAGGEDGGAKRRPALKTAGRKGHECDEHGNELHRQSTGRVAGLRYHPSMVRWPLGCLLVLCTAAVAGCDSDSSSSSPPPSGSAESVTGRERVGWIQGSVSASDMMVLQFAGYIDGSRRVLEGTTLLALERRQLLLFGAAAPDDCRAAHVGNRELLQFGQRRGRESAIAGNTADGLGHRRAIVAARVERRNVRGIGWAGASR